MSIIGKVERKAPRYKALNLMIHLVLLIGSVTMIYPFLLMISSSIKSSVDNTRLTLVPEYLHQDQSLYQKYLESRYNEESNRLGDNYAGKWLSFAEVKTPENYSNQVYQDWSAFLESNRSKYDSYDFYAAEHYGRGVYPRNQRAIRKLLKEENHGNLREFNNKYSTGVQTWEEIVIEEKDILSRNFISSSTGYLGRFQTFKLSLQDWNRLYINLDGSFVQNELIPAFNSDLAEFNRINGTSYCAWDQIILPRQCPARNDPLRDYWIHYVKDVLNIHQISLHGNSITGFRNNLRSKYADIRMLNGAWGTGFESFEQIVLPEKLPDSGAMIADLSNYIQNVATPEELEVNSIQNDFRDYLLRKYKNTDRLEEAWQVYYSSFEDVPFSAEYPSGNLFIGAAWQGFTQTIPEYLFVLNGAQQQYLDFLIRKLSLTGPDMSAINKLLGTSYLQTEDIAPSSMIPKTQPQRRVWIEFVNSNLDPKLLQIRDNEITRSLYTKYLETHYKNIEALNRDWFRDPATIEAYHFPQEQIEYGTFLEHRSSIRKEFIIRNYSMVLEQMLTDSRSLRNTLIYCLLSIILSVTVNPLAAYALSRFKPRFGYQLIMVFMLTMAFPAMVIGIPNFLMLKKLNLLNTFWALVLPAAADGYFIFLLKGFFDSLPREIYDSARIDGASEFRMFWQFTLFLSKPILAVIALGAFNAAYRNFLFAFIVCQDQSMWTLMVHIYELMQRASLSVGYAALVIAAIPTLLVFIFFQNIIIKGIVIPTEK